MGLSGRRHLSKLGVDCRMDSYKIYFQFATGAVTNQQFSLKRLAVMGVYKTIETIKQAIMPKFNEIKIFRRHVVLVAPEVHWNTGNIGRTCLGAEAVLHLIKPLGFSLDDRQVKRAGLDYWPKVPLRVWDDFDQFVCTMQPAEGEMVLMTKNGARPYWQMPILQRIIMVFGSETKGLPEPILERYGNHTYYIPIQSHIRCLNLSTAVGITLYENVRQWATK
jgi:tRNA (cytidine/uridine-2'-O-)-methyltransferase